MMKPPKPTKDDILTELESIRSSLIDEPETSHTSKSLNTYNPSNKKSAELKDQDIPVLDDLVIDDNVCPDTVEEAVSKLEHSKVIVEAQNQTENTFTDFESSTRTILKKGQDLLNLSNVIEDLKKTKAQLKGDLNNDDIPDVLPGQQSLFEEEILDLGDDLGDDFTDESDATHKELGQEIKTHNNTNRFFEPLKTRSSLQIDDSLEALNEQNARTPKAEKAAQEIFAKKPLSSKSIENPFLPPHIKERLAKQKMVLENDARAQDTALASLKNSVSELTGKPLESHFAKPPYPLNFESESSSTDPTNSNLIEPEIESEITKETIENDTTKIELNSYEQEEAIHTETDKTIGDATTLISQIDTSELVNKILTANLDNINQRAINEPDKQKLIESLIEHFKPELEKALRNHLNNIL